MKTVAGRSWLSWTSVAVLAALCGFLALLQNHWIAQLSFAEKDRLQQQLQNELNHLAREFDSEITGAVMGLLPSQPEIDGLGREKAYAIRYTQWRQSHEGIFTRIALAVPQESSINLLMLDLDNGQFAPADWPLDWHGVREELLAHLNRRPPGPPVSVPRSVITVPRFGPPRRPEEGGLGRTEQEWLAVELNLDHVRDTMVPDLLHRYLAAGGTKLDYRALLIDNFDPAKVIYQSAPDGSGHVREAPDASVVVFTVDYPRLMRARGGGPPPGFPPGPPPGGRG